MATPAANTALPHQGDPLGLWEPASPVPSTGPEAGLSFGLSEQPVPQSTIERVPLPAQPEQAQAQLHTMRAALRQGEVQLSAAERRIQRLGQTYTPSPARAVSFSALPASTPEAELQNTLDAIELAPPEELEQAPAQQKNMIQEWQAFAEQVYYKISYPVQVQTEFGQRLIGYTTVDWSGDFTTIWQQEIVRDDMTLHYQTVDLVLAKILARLRLVTVVTSGAANLTLKLTAPGTQLLVIPAVWKYVRDVLAVLRTQ